MFLIPESVRVISNEISIFKNDCNSSSYNKFSEQSKKWTSIHGLKCFVDKDYYILNIFFRIAVVEVPTNDSLEIDSPSDLVVANAMTLCGITSCLNNQWTSQEAICAEEST